MVKFAYNNFKNARTGHILFELNCGYHPCIFFEDEYNARFRSSSAKELTMELKELINVYCQNLLHVQDLEKQVYDKGVKPWNYISSKKIWLNSKHIKTKRNRKLET